MSAIGLIVCYRKDFAPANWAFTKIRGINRLYYIHSGSGCYEINGKRFSFDKNKLYFLPHTADFMLYNDSHDPLLHSFVDFELLPPYATNDVLSLEVNGDGLLQCAVDAFVKGSEHISQNKMTIDEFRKSHELFTMCTGSILYLTMRIARHHRIAPIADSTVLSVLEYMTENLSEKITVEEMAKKHYITPDCLTRKFSRTMGITPYAYLKALRISAAKSMLSDGKTLREAAELTGYSDSTALLHALKRK